DIPAEALVACAPHFAGPARAEQLNDRVWTDGLAGVQSPPLLGHRLREPIESWLDHEVAGGRVGLEQQGDLLPHGVIRSARSLHELGPLIGLELPRLVEDSKQPVLASLVHAAPWLESWRYNQARAKAHSL